MDSSHAIEVDPLLLMQDELQMAVRLTRFENWMTRHTSGPQLEVFDWVFTHAAAQSWYLSVFRPRKEISHRFHDLSCSRFCPTA